MEIVTAVLTLSNLRAMVRSAHLAKSLLNDELAQVFSYLGEAELQAAKQAVSDAKVSKTPQRETTLAIGHLQSAKIHFLASSKKERSRWFATGAKAAKLARGAYICDAMIASAYARLGDHKLKVQYAEQFRASFDEYFNDALNTRMAQDGFLELLNEELRAFLLLKSLGVTPWEPDRFFLRASEILSDQMRLKIISEAYFSVCCVMHEAHITVLRLLQAGGSLELGSNTNYSDLMVNTVTAYAMDPVEVSEDDMDLSPVRERLAEILQVMDKQGSYIKLGTDQLTSS